MDNNAMMLHELKMRIQNHNCDPHGIFREFLGDIKDKDRMIRAMENVDIVVHCAAQKFVDLAEYNPFFSIQTDVFGTQTCIEAALDANVDRFLYISTDKAVQAVCTYGRCKALSESLTIDANKYKGDRRTKLSVARPPNYIDSDGSVFAIWKHQLEHNLPLTVTDERMERLFMSFDDIISFIMKTLSVMQGGEIFVPIGVEKRKIIDMAREKSKDIKITGCRPGEKLIEMLMAPEEVGRAHVVDGIWVIK